MKIEVLFSEICNQFGDPQNAEYLRQSMPQAEMIYTPLTDEPYFVSGEPDVILLGSMSESIQRRVAGILRPLRDRLTALADAGKVILFTGNASDLLGKKITYVTEKLETEGIGIFDFTVTTDWFRRVNGKVIGEADGITVTGFRSQFAEMSGDNSSCGFINVERGFGLNEKSKIEGFRYKNLIATQLIGPILPLNPLFCEHLMELAGAAGFRAAFREEAIAAYDQRVREFRDPSTKF